MKGPGGVRGTGGEVHVPRVGGRAKNELGERGGICRTARDSLEQAESEVRCKTGDAAGAKGVSIPVAQHEILSFGAQRILNGNLCTRVKIRLQPRNVAASKKPAAGLTCGLGSGNRVWSLSDAAASDRPEAWLAGSVSACASSGWCRWIGPRRPAGRRLSSRARVGARARVHEPSPLPAEDRRAWEVTSEERR